MSQLSVAQCGGDGLGSGSEHQQESGFVAPCQLIRQPETGRRGERGEREERAAFIDASCGSEQPAHVSQYKQAPLRHLHRH